MLPTRACAEQHIVREQLVWQQCTSAAAQMAQQLTISSKKMAPSHRSLNALVAHSKNCPFGVNTTIELIDVTTASDKNGIQRGVFQLTSVPVLSDAAVTFFSSILVLTPNCDFWIVPLLHSESDIIMRRSEQNEFKTVPSRYKSD